MKLKLTATIKASIDLLFRSGTVVCTKDKSEYLYFPYWLKISSDDPDHVEFISPEKLPSDVVSILQSKRDPAFKVPFVQLSLFPELFKDEK
jgi:hypothetical protein